MSALALLPVRKELEGYFHSCELLLASVVEPDHSHSRTCFYANEVGKLVTAQGLTAA
jgi:hypothetical protein